MADWDVVSTAPFDPWAVKSVAPAGQKAEQPGMMSRIGSEIGSQFMTGASKVGSAFNPWSAERRAAIERSSKQPFFSLEPAKEAGELFGTGIAGVGQMAGSLFTGPVRELGAPAIQSIDVPLRAGTKAIFGPEAKLPPELTHEQAADVAESLMAGLGPRAAKGDLPFLARRTGPAEPSPLSPGVKSGEPLPSTEDILESSHRHYENLKDMNVPLPGHVASDLAEKIKATLKKEAFFEDDYKKIYRNVDRLISESGTSSSNEVYAARTALNNIAGDKPKSSKARAAKIAIEKMDEYLSNVPEFAETAQAARKDWAAGKTSELVNQLEDRARRAAQKSGVNANLDNQMRQHMSRLVDNPRYAKFLTEEEKDVVRALAKGGTYGNIARLLSKLGPKHPITGWASALAADLHGGSGAAMASLGLGSVAQWFSEKATTGRVRGLDELIRSRSALARQGRGDPVVSPRETVINDAKAALRNRDLKFTKDEKEILRAAARGSAPADRMLAAQKLLKRGEPPPSPGYGGPQ